MSINEKVNDGFFSKSKKTFYILLTILSLVARMGTAKAVMIKIGIEAKVCEIEDDKNILENKIKVGDMVTGRYVYESEAPDRDDFYWEGEYWYKYYNQSIYGIFFEAGEFSFQTDPERTFFIIETTNDHPCGPLDAMFIQSGSGFGAEILPLPDGTKVDYICLRFMDWSAQALSSDALPTTAPILDDWLDDKRLSIGGGHYPERWFSFNADIISAYIIPELIECDIDIKPGSCPNPLNFKSKGMLPVAILGSEDFDVNNIDVASIRLEGVAPIRSNYEDVSAPVSDQNECECTTSGSDNYKDLNLKFRTQEIVEELVNKYDNITQGDVLSLTLTGMLYDESPIEGADCIKAVGKVPTKQIEVKKSDINGDGMVNMLDFSFMAKTWLQSSNVQD